MWSKLAVQIKATLIAGFYWVYSHLWRVQEIGRGPSRDVTRAGLFAHWHGDELVLIRISMFRRMAIMASTSRDGDLMRRVLLLLGFRTVRGSSTRGGAAGLKGLIDLVRKEKLNASLAVDGPRGPIYEVKPGILKLAQETGLPIVPGASAASRKFIFKKAWNQCYLPLPFARVVVHYGEPIPIPKDLSEEALEEKRSQLQWALQELRQSAESEIHSPAKSQLRFDKPQGERQTSENF